MEIILKNDCNLVDEDVTEVVRRVKLLIRNSKNEVLLGYSHNAYQFPGGHVEDGEDLIEALNSEILEEVGVDLHIDTLEPFAERIDYYKDYPNVGINRKNEIYYYEYRSDILPNLDNTNYTDDEKIGNFELRYIPVESIIEEVSNNRDEEGNIKRIASEMLDVLNIYV